MNIKEDFIQQTQQEFIEKLREILSVPHGDSEYFIFCTDVYGFRNINRFYGVEAGSALLSAIDDFFSKQPSFLAHTRFYSDHFLYLMRYEQGVTDAVIIAERRERIRKFLAAQQESYPACRLNFPCGFSRIRADNVEAAIEEANFARKEAKKTGLGKIVAFDSELIREAAAKQELEEKLNVALQEEKFCFFLQPKVDLCSGEILGAEALVRGFDDHGAIVSPDRFLPVMEENGSITALDFLVCRQVCRFLADRLAKNLPVVRTSVNLSRLHTRSADAADLLHSVACEYGIPPELLQFELTETIFLNDFSEAKKLIDRLRLYGYSVAIDDFGSGYAGINIWQELNFDVLKLDKKFLSENPELKRRNEALLPNLINISQRLQTRVLCEGVETEEQCRYLLRLGCTHVQGFYFSRPVPPTEFYALYERQQGRYPVNFQTKKPLAGEERVKKRELFAKKTRRRSSRFSLYVVALSLCALFLTVSVISTFSYHRRSTQEKFENMTTETLNAYASEQKNEVLSEIHNQENTLKALSSLIGENSDQAFIEACLSVLNSNASENLFQYSDAQTLENALIGRPQDAETVRALKEGNTVVSDVYFSPSAGSIYCFAVGVPVFGTERQFLGALRGIVRAAELTSLTAFPASQGEVLSCRLTDSRGNVIPTDSATPLEESVFDRFASDYAREKLKELYAFINDPSRNSDVTSGRLGDAATSPVYASLASLGYKDWHLLIFVNAEAAAAHSRSVIRSSVAATALLLAAMLIVCAVFFYLSRRMEKRITSEERRYLLLEQFSDTVLFDYNFTRDVMRLTSNAEKLFKTHDLVQRSFLKNLERQYIYAGDLDTVKKMLTGESPQREARVRLIHPDTEQYFWCLVRFLYIRKKDALASVVGKIVDIDDLKQREDRLLQIAATDGLTGFLNKIATESQIREHLKRSQSGTLFMIDADDFKMVNDSYGHILGDKILRGLAERIRDVFGPENVLGRVGGDELVVFAPETMDEETAGRKAEALLKRMEEQTAPDAAPLSASIGIAFCPRDGHDFKQLFQAADKAMYEAKRAGKHCYRFCRKN